MSTLRQHLKRRGLPLLVLALSILLAGCAGNSGGPPNNALVLRWVHSTAIADWAAAAAEDFNSQEVQNSGGRIIYIEAVPSDDGQAVEDMLNSAQTGIELPDLWTTPDISWLDVLHTSAGSEVFLTSCESVAQSPLVIAMWEPIARTLGWPSRQLGWLDIASLAADPSGWDYYSGGEYGATLRIGHTHPGLSGSGVEALLAMVYAAQSSPERIGVEDVDNPIVQASVGAFESAVSWFASDTRQLATTMKERGLAFLNAAVVYENAVVNQGSGSPALVAIYPYEGTFVADFPTCVRAAMDDERTNGAGTFLAWLLEPAAQELAVSYGLRPANNAVSASPLINEQVGVDITQPEHVFASTDAATVFAIQSLWQNQRKNVNLALVLDVSGSMEGAKLEQMRLSAIEFVQQMGDDDRLTVIPFDDYPRTLVPTQRVGDDREGIVSAINTLSSGGSTALYDAILFGVSRLSSSRQSNEINAMVVLSDGQNTAGQVQGITQQFTQAVLDSGVSIYTIAYGSDADGPTLQGIALTTNGIAYVGDVSTIADIYAQISAAFGGSLGIGR